MGGCTSLTTRQIPQHCSDSELATTWRRSNSGGTKGQEIGIFCNAQQEDECERYNVCGKFGVCNELARPKCGCMEGFRPRDLGEWNRGNFSGGCVRNTPVECQCSSNETETGGDGFKAKRLQERVMMWRRKLLPVMDR
ncbi:G-type lectin S-receptor-like serine/threonine-protein kinase At1g11303 [Linum grandiflorum]